MDRNGVLEHGRMLWEEIYNVWAKEEFPCFPRLVEAKQFIKEQDNHSLKLFAQQYETGPAMRFVVASYDDFWRVYQYKEPSEKRFYEVIEECSPCKVYFDLEFDYKYNPHLKGKEDALMVTFVEFVIKDLKERFEIEVGFDDIVDLQSLDPSIEEKTVTGKFSRHVVINLPGPAAFEDNQMLGEYITTLEHKMRQQRKVSSAIDSLFCHSESSIEGNDETRSIFIDMSVYTKNRLFRLYLSSKSQKQRFLIPSTTFADRQREMDLFDDRSMFFKSLVCNVKPKIILKFKCPSEVLPSRPISQSARKRNGIPETPTATSPFPLIDEFVWSLIPFARKRSCVFRQSSMTILYFGGTRFCDRIGRNHKSNHVFYVADVKERIVYQKCTDLDCKGFRSVSTPLPVKCFPSNSYSEFADIPESVLDSIEEQMNKKRR